MKKMVVLFLTVSFIVEVITACSVKSDKAKIVFSFDTNGNYTGFSSLPTDYTIEEAEKEGYFVKEGMEVIANNEVWDSFIEQAAHGNDVGIRMATFYIEEETSGPFFCDLFFNEGYYYLFDGSSDNLEKQPFLYLLTLEGKFGIPLRDSGVVVLTDDSTLTFPVVMKSMYSSSMDFIQSVSTYRLVMFQ